MEARIPVLWQKKEAWKGIYLSAELIFKFGFTNLQLKQMIFDTWKEWDIAKDQQDSIKNKSCRDFPDGPVVKTLRSQCRGDTFDPWFGGKKSHSHVSH